MFEFRLPERDFWKTMNPMRFHTLAGAWLRPRQAEKPKKPEKSLSEYLTGG